MIRITMRCEHLLEAKELIEEAIIEGMQDEIDKEEAGTEFYPPWGTVEIEY